jgi:2-oxoglutarate ferredoxin oxidoreductase subunit alpha
VARKEGVKVARAHFHHLNPFPKNTGEVLARFEKVLLPEMNLGQLALLLRAKFLKDIVSYTKVEGKPFYRFEVLAKIRQLAG